MGSGDMLEDDLREPYTAWKISATPETNVGMLNALKPTIEGAIRTHVGEPNPLLTSRARMMTLQGLRSYDPKRGRLQTHIYNHLLGLKRVNRQQTQILQVPERVALDRFSVHGAEEELRNSLGREPTDDELADHTGFSTKRLAHVRTYQPGVSEGRLEDASGGQVFGATHSPADDHHSAWLNVIYDELDPYHKKIMELSYGVGGRPPLANHEIARRLNRSPGAISQGKARIQAMLDEESALSPFGETR